MVVDCGGVEIEINSDGTLISRSDKTSTESLSWRCQLPIMAALFHGSKVDTSLLENAAKGVERPQCPDAGLPRDLAQ